MWLWMVKNRISNFGWDKITNLEWLGWIYFDLRHDIVPWFSQTICMELSVFFFFGRFVLTGIVIFQESKLIRKHCKRWSYPFFSKVSLNKDMPTNLTLDYIYSLTFFVSDTFIKKCNRHKFKYVRCKQSFLTYWNVNVVKALASLFKRNVGHVHYLYSKCTYQKKNYIPIVMYWLAVHAIHPTI